MDFKVGDKIIVKKNLGEKGLYLYDASLRDFPLGSRGVIYGTCGNHYRIRFGSYALCLDPDEFEPDTDIEKRQREVDSLLENLLLVDEPLAGSEKTNGRRPFNPKFNTREEFAIWVREQFPWLKICAKRKKEYLSLTERREEVMGAARRAYEHAMETTHACTKAGFVVTFNHLIGQKTTRRDLTYGWVDLPGEGTHPFIPTGDDLNPPEDRPEFFARNLNKFVEYIEYVSANLNNGNHRHHGTAQ